MENHWVKLNISILCFHGDYFMLINIEMVLLKENIREMKKKKWAKYSMHWEEQEKCNCHIQVSLV